MNASNGMFPGIKAVRRLNTDIDWETQKHVADEAWYSVVDKVDESILSALNDLRGDIIVSALTAPCNR